MSVSVSNYIVEIDESTMLSPWLIITVLDTPGMSDVFYRGHYFFTSVIFDVFFSAFSRLSSIKSSFFLYDISYYRLLKEFTFFIFLLLGNSKNKEKNYLV